MLLVLIIVGYFLLFMVAEVIKDTYTKAKDRSDARIMSAYLAAEDARYHRQRLEEIDLTVRATSEEMERVAAEACGEVIEGTAVEVTRL